MKRVAAFDFDGTITCKDTLFDFIEYSFGKWGLYRCLLLNACSLAMYKLGIISNEKAKERLLGSLLKGINDNDFTAMCRKYSLARVPQILKKETLEKIAKHKHEGDILVIVSASPEDWIKPWALSNGFSTVLATQLKRDNGTLAGTFATRNCHGKEKVNRIAAEFGDRANIYITAYGDSKGDSAMLEYADRGYLIKKNKWTEYKR